MVSVYPTEARVDSDEREIENVEKNHMIASDEQLVQNAEHVAEHQESEKQVTFAASGFCPPGFIDRKRPTRRKTDQHPDFIHAHFQILQIPNPHCNSRYPEIQSVMFSMIRNPGMPLDFRLASSDNPLRLVLSYEGNAQLGSQEKLLEDGLGQGHRQITPFYSLNFIGWSGPILPKKFFLSIICIFFTNRVRYIR